MREKRIFFALACLIAIMFSQKAIAQTTNKQARPFDYKNVSASDGSVFYIDYGAKICRPLQKLLANIEVKQLNRDKQFYFHLRGAKANFTIPKIDSLVFLIKSDKELVIAIYRLQPEGQNCSVLGLKQKAGGNVKINFADHPDIFATPFEDGIYEIIVLASGGLPIGEYCFANNWDTEHKIVPIYRFAIK